MMRLSLNLVSKNYCTTQSLAISTAKVSSTNLTSKQAKLISKFLNSHKRRKKFFYNSYTFPALEKRDETSTRSEARRVSLINKLLMKCITDIITTGSLSTDLLNLNIDITRVSVSSDYKFVNVYWLSNNQCLDARIDEKLVETAKLLRHDLSRLKLLGNVPHIVFVRDKRQLELNFVHQLINSVESSRSNDQPFAHTEGNLSNRALPKMPTNVFGLDRASITEKIKRDMKKYGAKKFL
ncbi:hypothetical protein O3M35_003721 [Rhynocoris fuscipes]|uniref:Ribosome-binding factor A, mitochondrial n=1 Tax=Rhynocoris fuscipes TaxID=488301 RepID=A0AAW1CNG2_9HEMI